MATIEAIWLIGCNWSQTNLKCPHLAIQTHRIDLITTSTENTFQSTCHNIYISSNYFHLLRRSNCTTLTGRRSRATTRTPKFGAISIISPPVALSRNQKQSKSNQTQTGGRSTPRCVKCGMYGSNTNSIFFCVDWHFCWMNISNKIEHIYDLR